MDSLIRETRIKKGQLILPLKALTRIILIVLPVLLIFPHTALSINQAVGVENLEQNAVVPDGQEAQEFADEQGGMQAQDYGVVDNLGDGMNASDYDLILEIPIELENLYPQVTIYALTCRVGKRIQGSGGGSYTFHQYENAPTISVNIENGSYDGLFRFFYSIPQDLTPDDIDWYYCNSWLRTAGMGWHDPKENDPDGDTPAGFLLAPESTDSDKSGQVAW